MSIQLHGASGVFEVRYVTLRRVYGPYTILGSEQNMVYGPNCVAHLVVKEGLNLARAVFVSCLQNCQAS